MSTAGKVLIVLVMLMTFVWIVLASGVSRLNTNANTRLYELTEQGRRAPGQGQGHSVRDRLASDPNDADAGEDRPRIRPCFGPSSRTSNELARRSPTRSRRSSTSSSSSRARSRVLRPIWSTGTSNSRKRRPGSGPIGRQVAELMADCGKLRDRLASLRKEFQSNYHASIELLGKAASKTSEAPAGSAN